MFLNYLNFTLKNMKRNASSSLILLVGLAIAVSTLALIYSILTVDKGNELYKYPDRMVINDRSHRWKKNNNWWTSLNYKYLKQVEASDLIQYATIFQSSSHERWVNKENVKSRIMYTDHRFRDLFNIDIVKGRFYTEEEFLAARRVILLSEEMVEKVFGDADPIGKSVKIYQNDHEVIGVFKNVQQTHDRFSFDELLPLSTDEHADRETDVGQSSYNYRQAIVVKNVSDIRPLKQVMQEIADNFEVHPEDLKLQVYPYTLYEDTFTRRARLDGETLNRDNYNILVSSILLFIIISSICLINIINLKSTIYLNRYLEFGIRYSFGAKATDLLTQVLLEATLFGLMALTISLGLTSAFFTIINQLAVFKNKLFGINLNLFLLISAFVFLVSYAAHLVALLQIKNLKPVVLLKGV
ncbi:MAG: ABC transporter permease [Calditrichaeota bacterium]|nr:ABC transporter permease [Calditrichota bacterium]